MTIPGICILIRHSCGSKNPASQLWTPVPINSPRGRDLVVHNVLEAYLVMKEGETLLAKAPDKNYHIFMDIVDEIKRAIQTLTDEQRRELEAWWHSAYDEWDLQMDSDARAGKLDALSEQALKDYRAGNCDEFP